MKRCLLSLVFLVLLSQTLFARAKVQGYASQGAASVTINGITTTISQGTSNATFATYPNCTVAVYYAGGAIVPGASVYSDISGTVKGNPFTADANAYYFFYIDDGRYDIRFSGTGITTPFTIGGISVSESFNVLDYGADPTGTNDSATAIQNASNACASGSTVTFPKGTFTISAAINLSSNCSYVGVGPHSTIIELTSGASADTILFRSASLSNVQVSNIGFVGKSRVYDTDANRYKGAGIYATATSNLTVSNCYFYGVQTGVQASSVSSNIRVLDNEFLYDFNGFAPVDLDSVSGGIVSRDLMTNTVSHYGPINAIYLTAGGGTDLYNIVSNNIIKGFDCLGYETIVTFMQRGIISGNHIIGTDRTDGSGNPSNHRAIDVTSSAAGGLGDHITVSDNFISNTGAGIRLAVTGAIAAYLPEISVTGNVIQTVVNGITMSSIDPLVAETSPTHISISNNTVDDASDLGTGTLLYGCGIITEGNYLTLSGNQINNVSQVGIWVRSSQRVTVVGNTIKTASTGIYTSAWGLSIIGNIVSNTSGDGISCSAGGGLYGDIIISGNTVVDCGTSDDGTAPNIHFGINSRVERTSIIGNSAYQTLPATGTQYGIQIAFASGIVKDNNVWQNRTSGILLSSSPTTMYVSNNIGSTIVLPTPPLNALITTTNVPAGHYTPNSTDQVLICDTSVSQVDIDLPAPATFGKRLIIIKRRGAGAIVAIHPNGTQLIDGVNSSITLSNDNDAATLVCDGTQWYCVSNKN
jgi:parallel beta-helix repeat protein